MELASIGFGECIYDTTEGDKVSFEKAEGGVETPGDKLKPVSVRAPLVLDS